VAAAVCLAGFVALLTARPAGRKGGGAADAGPGGGAPPAP